MDDIRAYQSVLPENWRHKKNSILDDLENILNYIDAPVLAISDTGVILYTNSPLLDLTSYNLEELIGVHVNIILPEFPFKDDSTIIQTTLTRQLRSPLNVKLHHITFERQHDFDLLVIHAPGSVLGAFVGPLSKPGVFSALIDLSRLSLLPNLPDTITSAINISQVLLDAQIICLYTAEGRQPVFRRSDDSLPHADESLPLTINPSDIQELKLPFLWRPGKKTGTELHKHAKTSGLSYLASVPLGEENSWSGLLVCGDRQADPSDTLLRMLEIIAQVLWSAISHQISVTNLNLSSINTARSLLIRDAIAENAQEGVLLLKPDLSICELNPSAELILGYASHEVTGRPVADVLIGTDSLTSAYNTALQGIPISNLGIIKLHRRNGSSFPVEIQIYPIENQGTVHGIVVFLHDITENEQIRVKTQQLEQRAVLGEVSAIFAHEVRNPINNISMGLQLLGSKFKTDDPNHELISRLQTDCTRLTHLMESVLSFSRPMEFKMEPTDLPVLLQRILDRWRPRLSRANVESVFQPDANTPPIMGDPRTLEQVFTNLISNAVQAMSANGKGTLGIKTQAYQTSDDLSAEVTVSDNGPGIPPEIREHIFEPFVTTNAGGTGLGLAITRRIVNAHHGTIQVDSFPGGTIFHVHIPAYSKGKS
ncbi:MAG: PAS domain S-box protein [Anaerolineaceae bacterium]|nr:PAS domain S-box protein [Anaerolineaceae bacterium]MBN2678320.1 PAS domain S-box protein [Anaerolineaceae bacterium]